MGTAKSAERVVAPPLKSEAAADQGVAYARWLAAIQSHFGASLNREEAAQALSISRGSLRSSIMRFGLKFSDGRISAEDLARFLAGRKQVRAATILGLFSIAPTAELPRSRAQAIGSGEHFYFTGHPCRRGHLSPRVTMNSVCVDCFREMEAAHE